MSQQKIILIAHRGNIDGRKPEQENSPLHVKNALANFDAEVDVWYESGLWYLGHDGPKYEIPFDFLRQKGLWCHAKNLAALHNMLLSKDINCFWHQSDECVLTSRGYIWSIKYHGKGIVSVYNDILPSSVIYSRRSQEIMSQCFGICSDYVNELKKLLKAKYDA